MHYANWIMGVGSAEPPQKCPTAWDKNPKAWEKYAEPLH